METVIGILVGAVLALVVVVVFARSYGKKLLNKKVSEEIELRDRRAKAYEQLHSILGELSDYGEVKNFLRSIERRKNELSQRQYDQLVSSAQRKLDTQEGRIAAQPKLEAFRTLRHSNLSEKELFYALHHIIVLEDDDRYASISELSQYGEKGELDWLARTYDELLARYFHFLLLRARKGTREDFDEVMTIWRQLEGFVNESGENRAEFIECRFADEWNEMYVRFVRNPDYEGLYGLDNLDDDDYRSIINKAKQSDLFSMSVIPILMDGGDNFNAVLLEVFSEECAQQREAHYSAHPDLYDSGQQET